MNLNLRAANRIVGERYVNAKKQATVLGLALQGAVDDPLKRNVIFWGPGGYGKSEFAFDFIREATGRDPYVISLHKEISAAEIFGGVDIPSLQSGTLRYRVENSFMAHEVAILEEALDAPDSVLLALKDIITRRVFTIGEHYHIKTRLLIVNTNHDPSRMLSDASKAAFLERFPYRYRIDWTGIPRGELLFNYRELARLYAGDLPIEDDVADALVSVAADHSWSPRRFIQFIRALNDYAKSGYARTPKQIGFQVVSDVCDIIGSDIASALGAALAKHHTKSMESFYRGLKREATSLMTKFREKSGDSLDSVSVAYRETIGALNEILKRAIDARRRWPQSTDFERLLTELETDIGYYKYDLQKIVLELVEGSIGDELER